MEHAHPSYAHIVSTPDDKVQAQNFNAQILCINV
jgi:hypothetical protein